MENKIIKRASLQKVFDKNTQQVIDLIRGIGFPIKEEYTQKEFSLMIVFVNKSENKNCKQENYFDLFQESDKITHVEIYDRKARKKSA